MFSKVAQINERIYELKKDLDIFFEIIHYYRLVKMMHYNQADCGEKSIDFFEEKVEILYKALENNSNKEQSKDILLIFKQISLM